MKYSLIGLPKNECHRVPYRVPPSATRVPFFYKIYESLSSYIRVGISANEVFMRFWIDLMFYINSAPVLKELIKTIFKENKSRYGYRRVTLELKNRGYKINHKRVKRLMKLLNL